MPRFPFIECNTFLIDDQNNVKDSVDYLFTVFQENPGIVVELAGHCDLFESERKNRNCGLKRAKTIKEYIVDNGVNKRRLVATTYGSKKPLVKKEEIAALKNLSEADLEKIALRNNRVTVQVISFDFEP